MSGLTYKLSAYEGPLDLLYQLIKDNEIDICDIPIAALTEQYLSFLDNAEAKDMESMSEFSYMAAELLEIKSRILLPKEAKEKDDPRKELVNKLLEYEKMKAAANTLIDIEMVSVESFYKAPEYSLINSLKPVELPEGILEGVTITRLYEIFKEVMGKRELKIDKIRSSFNTVSKDMFTVEDKIDYILSILTLKGLISFYSLVTECEYKTEMIVTFLAVLELMKTDGVTVSQPKPFEDIKIILIRPDTKT